MAEIEFCDNCNNLLFLYSDKNNKLFLGCKLCENVKTLFIVHNVF